MGRDLLPRLYERTVPAAFAAGNYEIDGGWRENERRELLRAFLASAQGAARGLFRRR